MVSGSEYRKLAILVRNLQAIAKIDDERNTGFFMPMVTRPPRRRRQRLPEVVRERGEANHGWRSNRRRISHNQHDVHPGIDLRVPPRWLRNSVEGGDLRKDLLQCTTTAQGLEKHIGPGLPEGALGLFPDALGD